MTQTRILQAGRSRPVTNGAYYTASSLYRAGFRGWPLTVMTAIAGVESSWNPTRVNNNPSTRDYSVGLFQINYYGGLGPPRTQAYGSPAYLQNDPQAQANAAYNLAGGNSLSGLSNWGGGQWSGASGATPSFSEAGYQASFLAHLPQAAAATAQVGQLGPAPSSSLGVGSWPTTGSPTVVAGGYTMATDTSASIGQGGDCNSRTGITLFPGVGGLGSFGLNGCQVKGLIGGLILVSGGIISIIGISLIAVAAGKSALVPGAAGFAAGRKRELISEPPAKISKEDRAYMDATSSSEGVSNPGRRGPDTTLGGQFEDF